MAGASSATTEREQWGSSAATHQLALKWGWPRVRVDRLQGARLSIGREEGVDIQLHGPGVSRRHALLLRQGPVYVVQDLGSTNGTWVGGRAVEQVPLAPGNVLRIGEWVGVVSELHEHDIEVAELAPSVFGGSELAQLVTLLKRVASSSLPILLVGETGTGKERLARAAHHFSGRAGPFFALNCAAVPEHLAEAELFGYRRGAFTGAERASLGHFRAAHGGTLFLDEMPDLPPTLQAKLLRVVEEGVVLGLGESVGATINVRIVAAAQQPLAELVAEKRVRRDLAARLGAVELQLPTLSARRADIAPLFARFLAEHCGGHPPVVDARLVEALCLHDWPQNVRELELLTRTLLAVHGQESRLLHRHLPAVLAARCQERSAPQLPTPPRRDRRDHDLARLDQELGTNGGNLKAAAQAVGISRQRAYRLLNGSFSTLVKAASRSGEGDGTRD